MRAGPHQFFAGISSPNSSLSLSKRQAPSVSPPAPSATASDERTCSSEPGERDRSSPPRRGSSPTPQAGASPATECSRPPTPRARPSPRFLFGTTTRFRERPEIPCASPSSFSATRQPRSWRSLASRGALLVSRNRSPFATVAKVVVARSPLAGSPRSRGCRASVRNGMGALNWRGRGESRPRSGTRVKYSIIYKTFAHITLATPDALP